MKYIKWFGTFASIIGAFLVANMFMGIGYICFTLGSLSWLTVGYREKDYSLITLNGTFFIANLMGLYHAYV